jgi:UDP-N-acetylmuramate: L-alanyl-gamma-D-glutamyl-meso-diaminopimelate ligase
MAPDGLLAIWAGDKEAVALSRGAPCRTILYGLTTDELVKGVEVPYRATLVTNRSGAHRLALRVKWPEGGAMLLPTPLVGHHNARNALAAIILAREAAELSSTQIAEGLASFGGVALRQQLVGTRRSIRVYRDFAHHPEAVLQTIRAMRPLAGSGRLFVAYEPRSATACRRIHQQAYVEAFSQDAEVVLLAPVGRPEIPESERLDTVAIARELRRRGVTALSTSSLEQLTAAILSRIRPGDLLLLLSNGHFGHIDREILRSLSVKP